MTLHELSAIKIVIAAEVTNILLGHPNGLHISNLSEQTGIAGGKLSRILRLLTVKHVYQEGVPF